MVLPVSSLGWQTYPFPSDPGEWLTKIPHFERLKPERVAQKKFSCCKSQIQRNIQEELLFPATASSAFPMTIIQEGTSHLPKGASKPKQQCLRPSPPCIPFPTQDTRNLNKPQSNAQAEQEIVFVWFTFHFINVQIITLGVVSNIQKPGGQFQLCLSVFLLKKRRNSSWANRKIDACMYIYAWTHYLVSVYQILTLFSMYSSDQHKMRAQFRTSHGPKCLFL